MRVDKRHLISVDRAKVMYRGRLARRRAAGAHGESHLAGRSSQIRSLKSVPNSTFGQHFEGSRSRARRAGGMIEWWRGWPDGALPAGGAEGSESRNSMMG